MKYYLYIGMHLNPKGFNNLVQFYSILVWIYIKIIFVITLLPFVSIIFTSYLLQNV